MCSDTVAAPCIISGDSSGDDVVEETKGDTGRATSVIHYWLKTSIFSGRLVPCGSTRVTGDGGGSE